MMNLKYFGDFIDLFTQYHRKDILEGRFVKSEKVKLGTDLMLRLMGI